MALTIRKAVKTIAQIEAEMILKGVKLDEFLADVPLGRTAWSLWKNGHQLPTEVKWSDTEKAFERLKA